MRVGRRHVRLALVVTISTATPPAPRVHSSTYHRFGKHRLRRAASAGGAAYGDSACAMTAPRLVLSVSGPATSTPARAFADMQGSLAIVERQRSAYLTPDDRQYTRGRTSRNGAHIMTPPQQQPWCRYGKWRPKSLENITYISVLGPAVIHKAARHPDCALAGWSEYRRRVFHRRKLDRRPYYRRGPRCRVRLVFIEYYPIVIMKCAYLLQQPSILTSEERRRLSAATNVGMRSEPYRPATANAMPPATSPCLFDCPRAPTVQNRHPGAQHGRSQHWASSPLRAAVSGVTARVLEVCVPSCFRRDPRRTRCLVFVSQLYLPRRPRQADGRIMWRNTATA